MLPALADHPRAPRVVIVSMTGAESAMGLAALDAGAVEIVHKPTTLATDRLYDLSKELVEKVVAPRAVAEAGLGAESIPLELMAPAILERA